MPKQKEKKKQNFKTWLTWQLRRASYKWPPRGEALRKARIDRGKYRCAKCKRIFGNKEISLDHIKPVISPKEGWQGWEEYIKRLFVEAEGFQVLCDDDHDKKTAKERDIRKRYNKSDKT